MGRRTYSRRSLLTLPVAAIASGIILPRVLRADDLPPVDAAEMEDGAAVFRRGTHDGTHVTDDGLLVATAPGGTFTSPVRELKRPITHAGIHWRTTPNDDAQPEVWLQFATKNDEWSEWQRLLIETPPDGTPRGDYFAHLANTEGARALRYRIVFATGQEAALERLSATLIDASGPPLDAEALAAAGGSDLAPPAAPADGATADAVPNAVTRITIPGLASDWTADMSPGNAGYDVESGMSLPVVTRWSWGADESLRFGGNGRETWPEMFVPARFVAVHHTAGRNSYGPGESVNDVRAIYHYHAVGQGWGDIGYHALIDKYGVIYEGRHGRGGDPGDDSPTREVLSEGLVAGHATRHNYGSVGVGLIGNSLADGWEMYEPAGPRWEALVRYCTFECRRGFIRPGQSNGEPFVRDFLRSDNIWRLGAPTVGGHIHYQETECPGTPVLNLLPALRRAIHERMTGTSRTGVRLTAVTPDSLQASVGTPIGATWEAEPPEPGWELAGFEYRFEGWRLPPNLEDITYLAGYGPGKQPEAVWTPAPLDQRSAQFLPRSPGQYTLHVRALVRRGGQYARAAYEGMRTWLVV